MTPDVQPSIAEPRSPRGHWYRFRIRSLLISTTVLACFLGWVAKEQSQPKFERGVAEKLQEQGSRVLFLGAHDSQELFRKKEPQGWWRDLARKILGERISTITYSGEQKNLEMLAGLTNLEELNIEASICDLTLLTGLRNVKWLSINGSSVTDIAPLAELKNLERLGLYKSSVSDLTPIAGLTNLNSLTLNGPMVSDLTPLVGLTNLQSLGIGIASRSGRSNVSDNVRASDELRLVCRAPAREAKLLPSTSSMS